MKLGPGDVTNKQLRVHNTLTNTLGLYNVMEFGFCPSDNPPDLLTKPLSQTEIEHLLRTLFAWGGADPTPEGTLKAVLPRLDAPGSDLPQPPSSKRRRFS